MTYDEWLFKKLGRYDVKERTLQQAFNAVFHDDALYQEFLNVDFDKEISEFEVSGRSVIKASNKLKRFLRFVDRVILRFIEVDADVVHSFVKGRSALTAVEAHKKGKYFFCTDIVDFYGGVGVDDVGRILGRSVSRIPISDIEGNLDYLKKMVTFKGAIPVGFPTSPQLSNAFLADFDSALKNECNNRGVVYSRYADDIIISSQDRSMIEDMTCVVQNMLVEFASPKMKINIDKTYITKVGNKVKILGLVITPDGRVTIDSKHKNNIEVLVHFFLNDKDKFKKTLDASLQKGERSLFGLLHYAKSIDPAYIHKLERKYGVHSVRSLMENNWDE